MTENKEKKKLVIYDIWEITSNDRYQISRIESENIDQCVKMVLDHYVKPEFHKDANEEYVDENLIYLTIPDPDIDENIDDDFEIESNDLTYEIFVSDDQENRSFKVISGHDEFITLDENGKTKTPFSLGKLLDQTKELSEKLND